MAMNPAALFSILLCLTTFFSASAQIITTDPIFPKAADKITITYDATQGTGQLAGLPLGTAVFAHTGITTPNGKWQYVTGNWGTSDPRVLMNRIGNTDLYQLTFDPSLFDWFSANNNSNATIPAGTTISEIGFVFRNTDGSLEGKTADWQDIFIPVYSASSSLLAKFVTPASDFIAGEGDIIPVYAAASIPANLYLYDNGNLLTQSFNDSLSYNITAEPGLHQLVLLAEKDTEFQSDTLHYIVNAPIPSAALPPNTKHGINIIDENTVRLALFAPEKEYVYVLGDFNNWTPNPEFFMNRTPDGTTWWLDIENLNPNQEYAFQYLVDGVIKVADPYSEKILDPFHDNFIPSSTYPNLKPYPQNKTTGIVTAFSTSPEDYNWQHDNYARPPKENLIIYELLLRDFLATHDYQTLLDTLDYLDNLGINAIELMPINEFEGNLSWGYNPSFHMALDKYYGTPEALKSFIDACHERGIAVIADIVLNHAFSQSPLAQLYWNVTDGKPASNNPWLNENPTHDFNVGSDFNHESPATKAFVNRIITYWIEEFHLDGYRFDLSKGFTQNVGGSWDASAYDPSRIAILKGIADSIWAINPEFYVILEHFCANTEEKELADYGMLLWGNMNYAYNEATMGYSSNLNAAAYTKRGWNLPHLITYMESHDEERLMYKNLQYGNSGAAGYSVKDLFTALQRIELGAAFLLTIPGPKMIWQFGELGYDYSIFTCSNGTVQEGNTDCKLSAKPIHWDFYQQPARRQLFDVFKALTTLKLNYPTFSTADFDLLIDQSAWKRINLNHQDFNASILGNFDVKQRNLTGNFQHTGWWYEYFSGDSLNVTNTDLVLTFGPGEYRLYTDKNIGKADILLSNHQPSQIIKEAGIFPNPASENGTLLFYLQKSGKLTINCTDLTGKTECLFTGSLSSGYQEISVEKNISGMYFITIQPEKEQGITIPWVIN